MSASQTTSGETPNFLGPFSSYEELEIAKKWALVNIPLTGCRVCQASSVYVSQSRLNSNKTYITRTHRHTYLRTYPAILVKPDGSSIHIRYKEPRKLLQMPVDINTLTEEERQIRLARRKPKQKVKVMEDNIEDTFDNSQYQFMWKNKN